MKTAVRGAERLGAAALRSISALALCLALGGCIDTGIDGAAAYVGSIGGPSAPLAKPSAVQVFVVSTRAGESGAAAQQAASDGAHYSLATLTIPPGHRTGSIEEPMWGSSDARNHIVVTGRRELDPDEFHAELASHISGRIGVNRDILVFVHGYKNGFEEARLRTAQIAADSHFGGVPILFTWPSKNEILGYASDKDSATASRDALQELLEDLAKTPGIGKVHILAHSMGGWLAMEALRQSAIAGNHGLSGRLGEVMLASPDIDMDVFAKQMTKIQLAAVTVFATANDRALSLSSVIAQARQRVGAIDPSKPEDRATLEKLGAKVYDLSSFSGGFVGHTIYADAPDVIHAIGAQLATPRAQEVNAVSIIDATADATPAADTAPIIGASR